MIPHSPVQGILLVNKPRGMNSFQLVKILRKRLQVKKIGHSGILDPFATGVMVMLIGRNYTRLSQTFLNQDKEYIAEAFLGKATDTHDCEGQVISTSDNVPSFDEIQEALKFFHGTFEQVPPMFSAKKHKGQKLYTLARQGIEVERPPVLVTVDMQCLLYEYPRLVLRMRCSKGTYVRQIAHDLGLKLGCGAHLTALERTRSGKFHLKDCLDGSQLMSPEVDIASNLQG